MTTEISARARPGFWARLLSLALVLALAPACAARAQFGIPGFELVHNAPLETSLSNPDLRDPVTVWVEMFDGAKRSIDLEQFYVSGMPGEPLDRVIAALEAASARGVNIRFLMEENGLSASDTPTLDRLKAIPNLEYRLLKWSKVKGSGIIHAKFFIVDGEAAFVGSHNFDWRALKHIDETGLHITQPRIVGQMGAIFAQDWKAAALLAAGETVPPLRETVQPPDDAEAFLVASPNAFNPDGVGDSESTLIDLIGAAKREIRVEVMEYSPRAFGGGTYTKIDDALRAAAARGVQVRLLVADWAMWPDSLPSFESLDAVPNVEVRVASIPPASTGFIPYARVTHTKIMAIDGELAWVGTSNWQGGYFDDSRNLEVVMRNRKMAERVAALQKQMWDSPYAKPFSEAKSTPRPKTRPDPPQSSP